MINATAALAGLGSGVSISGSEEIRDSLILSEEQLHRLLVGFSVFIFNCLGIVFLFMCPFSPSRLRARLKLPTSACYLGFVLAEVLRLSIRRVPPLLTS